MSSRQTRRGFLKTASMAGASVLLSPSIAIGRSQGRTFSHFGLHPFIEAHPQAVFILQTNVDAMTNAPAIKTAAELLGKTLGVPASSMSIREANYLYDDFAEGGYIDLAARTGVDMKNLSAKVGVIDERELNWMDVPGGVWFHRIPYLRPINTPGSVLINIAKLKTHAMGMTLCAKNLQGTIAAKYVQHCAAYGSEANMEMREEDMNPTGNVTILHNYEQHKQRGVPRWDRPDPDGGLWQETWATRCLDNNSVLHPFLNIIEGIYGRDGHFVAGPNDGLAKDYLANVVLFGKNAFHVDLVGSWLAGHEPGNFGLFHMAMSGLRSSIFRENWLTSSSMHRFPQAIISPPGRPGECRQVCILDGCRSTDTGKRSHHSPCSFVSLQPSPLSSRVIRLFCRSPTFTGSNDTTHLYNAGSV